MKRILLGCALIVWTALSGAAESVRMAPDFDLPDAAGKTVRLSDFRGKQAVYLDFWASWCIPCRKSFPWMNELQARYPNLKIVAVNVDERREDADKFLAAIPARFPIVFDSKSTVAKAYNLKAMPASFLVDREGVVRMEHKGFRQEDAAALEKQLASLLQPGK